MNTVLVERTLRTSQTIQIVQGDLCTESSGAIVNAANSQLQHGAGVARAIVSCGRPLIQQESDMWIRERGPVSHAQPAWTSGGRLPAKYVVHAVGPIWGEGEEDRKLAAAIHGSLQVADALKLTSISLPAISTGVFGFPKDRAGRVILSAIENYFAQNKSSINLVRVVLFDPATVDAVTKAWRP